MSTPRQAKANRGNAASSTGPRTQPGKARASRNARRHGFSVSVFSDPRLSKEVEDLTRLIVGETSRPELLEMARRFAEAQIDLDRIRKARHHALLCALDEGADNARSENALPEVELILRERLRQFKSFDRYERRALSRRRSAARAFDTAFLEAVRRQGFPASVCGAGDDVEHRSPHGHATRFKTKTAAHSEMKTASDQPSEPDDREQKPESKSAEVIKIEIVTDRLIGQAAALLGRDFTITLEDIRLTKDSKPT
jgi:hypothetical protein